MTKYPVIDTYSRCRTYGHAWYEADVKKAPTFGFPIWLRCERCSTLRVDLVDRRDGKLLARYYDYPADYETHGEARLTRQQWRRYLVGLRAQVKLEGKRLRAVK